ncbi:hypothetical protein [Sphingorhabdus sp. SMR4y]|uniref:hypothetical protein n=1 Tax=Sphingorhabdus sp. SMR4y TaxID=2584094 RepID=UPI000B5CEA0D|nr:hypothetical protein [Sphingorhabdus sp. SMR4y]ASK88784.1 hypothetical protein SPHFLASMR4Y_02039 [Sphingorhabdus sp. SMR4y]
MKKLPALVTIITLMLSGCAMQDGDFPSLLERPYENAPVTGEAPAPATAISALPADMQARLGAAVASSRAADIKYRVRLPAVKKLVNAARGAAQSSEAWVVAHMELAALEIERSPSVEALADIDALYREQLEQQAAADESGGTAIIGAQRDLVLAQVNRQQAEIEAMKDLLR